MIPMVMEYSLDCRGCKGHEGRKGSTGPKGSDGIHHMPMLSTPPTNKGRGFYLDDGSNRVSGLPGFRYWDKETLTWIN